MANYEKRVEATRRLAKETNDSSSPSHRVEEGADRRIRPARGHHGGELQVPGDYTVVEALPARTAKWLPCATADSHTACSGYGSEKVLRRGLQAAKYSKTGLIAKADAAKMIALLPDGAHLVALVSPKELILLVNTIGGSWDRCESHRRTCRPSRRRRRSDWP